MLCIGFFLIDGRWPYLLGSLLGSTPSVCSVRKWVFPICEYTGLLGCSSGRCTAVRTFRMTGGRRTIWGACEEVPKDLLIDLYKQMSSQHIIPDQEVIDALRADGDPKELAAEK